MAGESAPDRRAYQRQWYEANKERQKELAAARKAADPERIREQGRKKQAAYRARRTQEQREAALAKSREWHAQNVEWRRQWTEANKERAREYGRRWAQANRPHLAAKASRRRGAPLSAEAREWLPVLLADPCVYCGAREVTLDHIIPIAAGGNGDLENLAPACGSCNSSKADRPLLVFLLARR